MYTQVAVPVANGDRLIDRLVLWAKHKGLHVKPKQIEYWEVGSQRLTWVDCYLLSSSLEVTSIIGGIVSGEIDIERPTSVALHVVRLVAAPAVID